MSMAILRNGSDWRGFTAALPILFLLISLILAGGRAEAGTFQIVPTLGDVPPGKSTATFRITNPGNETLTVQVSAQRWTQENNADVLQDTDELLVVPPLVNIAPGKTQVVRLARHGGNNEREASYRIFFQEVPSAPPQGFVGVQTSLRLSVPLFFAPAEAEGKMTWTASRLSNGNIRLQADNVGSRFARITHIALRDKDKREVADLRGPLYVLAGATRYWDMPVSTQASPGKELTAIVEMGSTRQEFPLQIE